MKALTLMDTRRPHNLDSALVMEQRWVISPTGAQCWLMSFQSLGDRKTRGRLGWSGQSYTNSFSLFGFLLHLVRACCNAQDYHYYYWAAPTFTATHKIIINTSKYARVLLRDTFWTFCIYVHLLFSNLGCWCATNIILLTYHPTCKSYPHPRPYMFPSL
jgi:hypothetical protein